MTGDQSRDKTAAKDGRILDGRYELLDVLGAGGMGTVYRAKHLVIGRFVAVKLLHPHVVNDDASVLRFNQEVHAMSVVNHPHLISISDAGVTPEGAPYFVMEYLEGRSLSDLLDDEKQLPVRRILSICIEIAEALSYAHERGIVHRDLKPSNIMLLGRNDFVKVVDLGIAKLVTPDNADMKKLTMTGEVFGSPLYMSPEQCLGKTIDGRSDIYALGCLMYELSTGVPPIQANGPLEVLMRQVSEMPVSFSQLQWLAYSPELAHLEQIILRCVQKDPGQRYQSMAILQEELESLLRWSQKDPKQRQPLFTIEQGVETAGAGSGMQEVSGDTSQERSVGSPTGVVKGDTTEPAKAVAPAVTPQQQSVAEAGSLQRHIPLALIVLGVFGLIGLVAAIGFVAQTLQSSKNAPDSAGSNLINYAQPPVDRSKAHQQATWLPGSDGVQVGADDHEKHVFVVAAREGIRPSEFADKPDVWGDIDVLVKPSDKPIDLVLIGYNPIHWHIKRQSPAVKIAKVIGSGYHSFTVDALPNTEVIRSWYQRRDENDQLVKKARQNPFEYIIITNYTDIKQSSDWPNIERLVKEQTGAEPYKFWGKFVGEQFVIE